MASWKRNGIERMRRNPWWLVIGASPLAAALGAVVAALATGDKVFLTPVFHLLAFGVLGAYFAHSINKNPRFVAARIEIDEHTIKHGDAVACRRADIKSGLLVPSKSGDEWFVRLERKGLSSSVQLRVRSEEEGLEVLTALGLDASQSVATVRGLSPYFSLTRGKLWLASLLPALLFALLFGAILLLGRAVAPFVLTGFVMAMLSLLVVMMVRSRISIGADGILTEWLGLKRFHPFSEVREVVSVERALITKSYLGVELRKRDDSTTFIPIGQRQFVEEDHRATVERIREALQVYASGSSADAARLVERGGRSQREWVSALRRLGTGADADMRTAPVDASALLRVMSDPRAKPAVRAGAAIALATSESAAEEHRVRIRAAASAAAAPKLRIALEKAAEPEPDEDALAELLAELEQPVEPRRAKR